MSDFDLNKVLLERTESTDKGTFGKLTYNNFVCFTCELPWKDNQSDISCIPKGIYHCAWSHSNRLQKETYELLNVPHRDGIRIHSANYPSELLGCITLGKTIETVNGNKGVFQSRDTIEVFNKLMQEKDFIMEII